MSSKVREWLLKGEMIAAQEQQRIPADTYALYNDDREVSFPGAAAREKQNLSGRYYHKKLPSSDSSVIPFAEISRAEGAKNDKQSKQRSKGVRDLTCEERPPRAEGRRTGDFRRRPRHKIRCPSQNQTAEPRKEKRKVPAKKEESKSSHLNRKKQGNVLVDGFSADHLTRDRLTLRPSHNLGIFKKGRASTPVKKGLPDLAFSEMKFLYGRPSELFVGQKISPKHTKNKRSYFESSKRCLEQKMSRTIMTSSDDYGELSKRRRKDGSSTPDKRPTKVTVVENPIRLSPRTAMVDNLRRKGIYSLPANISSRVSACDSIIISDRHVDEENSDEGIGDGKGTDEHSEYSRVGFQNRFRLDTDNPVRLPKEVSSSSITEPPKNIKGTHGSKIRGGDGSQPCLVTAQAKEPSNRRTYNASICAGLTNTNDRSPAPKSRCAPGPVKNHQTPGSSSPLAALLRVCAESPERLVAHKKHDHGHVEQIGRDDHRSSRNPQRPEYCPQKSGPTQPPVDLKDCVDMQSASLLDVIRTRQLIKIEGVHHYSSSPCALHTKATRYTLSEIQQNGRDPNIQDWIVGSLSESDINAKNPDDYAYDHPEHRTPEVEEQYMSEFDTCEGVRNEGSVQDITGEPDLPSAPGSWVGGSDIPYLNEWTRVNWDIHDSQYSHSKAGVKQRRAMNLAQQCHMNREESMRGSGGYVQQGLETPGPKRENFWRKHTL